MSQVIDISGKRFGKWKVLCFVGIENKRSIWKCQCNCGETKNLSSDAVRGCKGVLGCKTCDDRIGHPKEGTALRNLFSRYRSGAKKRNILFNLTIEHFKTLTTGECQYCGSVPEYTIRAKSGEVMKYNGIDRLVNSDGYSQENCVTCCGICNRWKSSMTKEEFLAHAKKVVEKAVIEASSQSF